MNLLRTIIYGIVSGLAELFPISSQAHQTLMLHLFGVDQKDPLCDLLVHIAIILAVLVSKRSMIVRLGIQNRILQSRRRNSRQTQSELAFELRFIKTAAVPLVFTMLLYIPVQKMEITPLLISLFLVINGLVIFFPEYIPHGNKTARLMTGIDAIVVGILSGLGVFSGISRVGLAFSYITARGADRHKAINWIILLSIPALLMFIIFDLVLMFSGFTAFVTSLSLVYGLVAALFAFTGAYLAIFSLNFLLDRTGFSFFSYYCWGAALFNFILYLIS